MNVAVAVATPAVNDPMHNDEPIIHSARCRSWIVHATFTPPPHSYTRYIHTHTQHRNTNNKHSKSIIFLVLGS